MLFLAAMTLHIAGCCYLTVIFVNKTHIPENDLIGKSKKKYYILYELYSICECILFLFVFLKLSSKRSEN